MGKHLILDLESTDKLMNDIKFISNLLLKLTQLVDMNPLTKPNVVKGAPYNPGVTGFIIIETSHIAIHTFTKENRISFDLYSCRDYNSTKVLKFLKKQLKIKILNKTLIKRDDFFKEK